MVRLRCARRPRAFARACAARARASRIDRRTSSPAPRRDQGGRSAPPDPAVLHPTSLLADDGGHTHAFAHRRFRACWANRPLWTRFRGSLGGTRANPARTDSENVGGVPPPPAHCIIQSRSWRRLRYRRTI